MILLLVLLTKVKLARNKPLSFIPKEFHDLKQEALSNQYLSILMLLSQTIFLYLKPSSFISRKAW